MTRIFEIVAKDGITGLFYAVKEFILWKSIPYRFKLETQKNNLMNHIQFAAPPKPYNTIDIRPDQIDYRVGRNKQNSGYHSVQKVKKSGIGRVKPGKWDGQQHKVHINNCYKINSIINRFAENANWEETEYYRRYIEKYGKNLTEKKFDKIDSLFEDMNKNGYRTDYNDFDSKVASPQPARDQLEVLVTIDRNGKIHFLEGQHRFAMARILKMGIPAHVVCRHKEWQKTRDNIYNNEIAKERYQEIQNHPDLQDILD